MNGIICYVCGIAFKSSLSNYKRHLRNKHAIIEQDNYNIKCLEIGCNYKCYMVNDLRNHLQQVHDIQHEVEELVFKDMEEYLKWKKAEEIATNCSWVKHRGIRENTIYYACNRSGMERLIHQEQRKRMLKAQGSCKINCTCTSAITLKNMHDNITIKYYKTHYGHSDKVARALLQASANMIETQLTGEVPAPEILNKIRESVDNDFMRINLVTNEDIRNICQAFSIYDKTIPHANDPVGVDMWETEISQSTEKCVIMYKKQGVADKNYSLRDNDFLLGIMTEYQTEMLKKFGNEGILCMDAIDGTNPDDCKLICLITVNNYGEGLPVAFLISNRHDYVVLKYFISSVKEISGDIKAKIFMCDDAEQYFAAWSSIMCTSETEKLLCDWHIDKAWRNKITLIKNKEKQIQIYKTLCVLKQEPSIKEFHKNLHSFNTLLESDSELLEFKDYFFTNYGNRCKCWAACYRLDFSINTTMYLEATHKVLKYIYLKGTVCKQLDKTIHILIKYIRDKQFQQITKIDGKIATTISKINDGITDNSNTLSDISTENDYGDHQTDMDLNNLGTDEVCLIQNQISDNINVFHNTNWRNITDQDTLSKINDHLLSAVNLILHAPGSSSAKEVCTVKK